MEGACGKRRLSFVVLGSAKALALGMALLAIGAGCGEIRDEGADQDVPADDPSDVGLGDAGASGDAGEGDDHPGADAGDDEPDVGNGDAGEGEGDAGGGQQEYPPPPYGVRAGDTLANLPFLGIDGTAVTMEDWMGARVILLNSSEGRCAACSEEAYHLEDWYNSYKEQGLMIITALFEDDRYRPANPEYAAQWANVHGSTHPVVADPDFVLGQYYDVGATPMNMLVRGGTMEILEIRTGFDEVSLRRTMLEYLSE